MNNAINFYDNKEILSAGDILSGSKGSNYEYEMVESVSNAATNPFDAIEIIVNMAKRDRQRFASSLRGFYQDVKNFFENPANKMNIYVDKATYDNIISDCEKGINDPLFSMPSVKTAKNRFIEMLDTYIKLHKEIPSVLK